MSFGKEQVFVDELSSSGFILHFSTGVMWNSTLLAHQQMCCRVTLSPGYISYTIDDLMVMSAVQSAQAVQSFQSQEQSTVECLLQVLDQDRHNNCTGFTFIFNTLEESSICSFLPNFLLWITATAPPPVYFRSYFAAFADESDLQMSYVCNKVLLIKMQGSP